MLIGISARMFTFLRWVVCITFVGVVLIYYNAILPRNFKIYQQAEKLHKQV